MKTKFIVGFLVILSFFSAEAFAEIKICGSTTVQKRILEPSRDAIKQRGIDLLIVGSGTGTGMASLVKGECHVAMASEDLEDAITSMLAVAKVEVPKDLKPHVIAEDVIKVVVNKSNPVNKLTKEQLKAIHTGKITNWKEVGGKEDLIVVVTSHLGSATRKVFQKTIMDNEPYLKDAIEVKTTREEINEVSAIPEAIGAVSEGFLKLPEFKDKVKIIDAPEIKRPLLLITKGEPTEQIKKLIDFLKTEGKKYIKD